MHGLSAAGTRVFDQTTHSHVAATITGDDGYYQLTGLQPATYLVQFVDPQRRYRATWYAGALLPTNATPATLAAGSSTWASAWLGA